jgi:hypothetical protein
MVYCQREKKVVSSNLSIEDALLTTASIDKNQEKRESREF